MASKSLGTLTVDLIAKIGGFVSGMTQAEKAAAKSARAIEREKREMAKRMERIYGNIKTTAITAFTAIGAAAATAVTMAVKSGIEQADKFDEVAQRLQVNVEKLQGLNYAANLSGVEFSDLESALPKLSKAMAEAQEEGSKFNILFKTLGIDVVDATGKLRPAIDVLLELTDRFKAYDDATGEAALAMELFGKSGAKFLEFLNRGSEDIQGLMQRAEDLGLIIGEDTASQLADFNDRIGELKTGVTVLGAEIAASLVPEILSMIRNFQEWRKDGQAASQIMEVLSGTIDVVKIALNGLGAVYEFVKGIIAAFITTLGSVTAMLVRFGEIVWTVISRITSFKWRGITAEIQKGYAEIWRISKEGGEAVDNILETGNKAIRGHANSAWHTLNGTMTESEKASARAAAAQDKMAERARNSSDLISRQASGIEAFTGTVNQSTKAVENWGKTQAEVNQSQVRAEEVATSTGRIVPKSLFAGGGGGGGGSKKGGASSRSKEISEEEKAAERLEEQYQDIIQQYNEKIYLIGQEGELAKRTYDTQYGALKNLTDAKKQEILTAAEMFDLAKEQDELDKKKRQDYEQDKKNAEEIISQMQFELTLLGKTIEEQERLNLLRQLGTNIEQELIDKAVAAQQALQASQEQVARQIEISDQIRSSFSDMVVDIASGAKSFKDAFLGALDAINQRIMRMIADNWAEKLFGQFGSAGGGSAGGGWLSNIASWLFGGGKATGGAALPNTMYRVNENGPEMLSVKGKDFLMMGNNSGTITPNNMIRGQSGFSQTNNFVIQGKIDRRTEMQIAQESGRRAQAAQARNN